VSTEKNVPEQNGTGRSRAYFAFARSTSSGRLGMRTGQVEGAMAQMEREWKAKSELRIPRGRWHGWAAKIVVPYGSLPDDRDRAPL
jgi:hypothetical protein